MLHFYSQKNDRLPSHLLPSSPDGDGDDDDDCNDDAAHDDPEADDDVKGYLGLSSSLINVGQRLAQPQWRDRTC